ncbi:MAG: MarR family winged helix-turn-helix transcriptional regulator [Lactovum sp.]
MSNNTNELLTLFAKFLRNPRVIMAMHIKFMSEKLLSRGNRNGAQGLLVELWKKDGLANTEIAEMLDIKPSSVTAQVKQLEERGYIERRTDENDGRIIRVFLTKKGRNAETNYQEQQDKISEQVFEVLTAEEQEKLKFLLEKLLESQSNDDSIFEELKVEGFPDIRLIIDEMKRGMRDLIKEDYPHYEKLFEERKRKVFSDWDKKSKIKNEKNEMGWDDF